MKRTQKKVDRLITLSCDRMCDGGAWGTKDHKLLVHTLDALNDEIREINNKLFAVAGMAHFDIALSACRYVEMLKEERREFNRIREQSTKVSTSTHEVRQKLQGELFK